MHREVLDDGSEGEGGEEGQQKGKKTLIYGTIGIVVIFAIWGLVNILLNTLNSAVGVSAPVPSSSTASPRAPVPGAR